MSTKALCVLLVFAVILVWGSAAWADVIWDFEDGDDHGFILTGLKEGQLPEGGLAWSIGPPNQFDGEVPAVEEGCHIVDGLLEYGPCNNPFGVDFDADPAVGYLNGRGQSSYLNTYNRNQWGDELHTAENDQIATSPPVLLEENSELTVWAIGNTTASWAQPRMAPEFDPDPAEGYVTGSGGIAVLSAQDGTLLTSLLVAVQTGGPGNMPGEVTLDLSDFAGQEVIIEVVDAFAGGWGWMAVDEIRIAKKADLPTVEWDFENGNDHGFTLSSLNPATPAADDPAVAGDEAITGGWEEGNPNNLPEAGVTWTIGLPTQMDGLLPGADPANARVDANGLLDYFAGTERMTADHSFLNTFNLNYHGDFVHTQENDQIATSPTVHLYEGAILTASVAASGADHAPALDEPGKGYTDGSGGIAVLSADDGSLLASMETEGRNFEDDFVLDLSAFAGQTVIIEVVDAHEGGWGWMAVDSIRITNAILTVVWDFENGNDHGFTLSSLNPATPAADDPAVAGDEAITGGWEEGNPNNLPEAGVTWTIGPPTQMDGLLPGADPANARVDANGLLDYFAGTERMTADHSFLNTFNLNYHGDFVHTQENDQIATSPTVLLYEGAILTASVAASGADHAPALDEPGKGYTDGSGGIAVLSADDGSLLASMETEGRSFEDDFVLDLSAFAGQKVIIEVVDAHEGGWGWMAVDEIRIDNAIPAEAEEVTLGEIEAISPLPDAVDVGAPVIFWWKAHPAVAGTIETYVLYVDTNRDLVAEPDLPDQPMLVGGEEIAADPANPEGLHIWSGPVDSGATYFWRVDAVVLEPDGSAVLGVIVGPVLEFTAL